MSFYDRVILPKLTDCVCGAGRVKREREAIVPLAHGDVLEVGCGSGVNFELYDPVRVTSVHAVEPCSGMMKRAAKRLAGLESAPPITLEETGGEAVSLDANSIDSVVFTFVLCTIPDWRATLDEARRVLRPDGKVYFVEHGLSPEPGVEAWQHRLEPIQKKLGGGCHFTRSTQDMLTEAGFEFDRLNKGYMPKTPRCVAFSTFLYRGIARAA